MSLGEPDLMHSHVHRASSAVHHDVPITWNTKGRARAIYTTVSTQLTAKEVTRGDNSLQTASNGHAEELRFARNYSTMIDNKYQRQMSKAIDVAQLSSGTARAAGVQPSGLPNIITYFKCLFCGKYLSCMPFHHLINKSY